MINVRSLSTLFTIITSSNAQSSGLSNVKSALVCKSIKLTATTIVDNSLNIWEIGAHQKINLSNMINNQEYNLNSQQRTSKGSEMKGQIAVDVFADTWRRFQSRFGLEYVFIDMGCSREDAKSYSVDMTSLTTGWTNIYDASGHLLTKGYGESSIAEEADLKAWGLSQEVFQSSQESEKIRLIHH